LPAVAEVWMDGELQPGRGETWELTSQPLPHPWSAHLFDVAARWSAGGQEFEWESQVPVIAGHTGQSVVARGVPVKPESRSPAAHDKLAGSSRAASR
jgi:hypothetical protein